MTHVLRFVLAVASVVCWPKATSAEAPPPRDRVKVAAVQISGYDKAELPRPGYDAADALVPYIQRAAADGCQLVVFPEYVLGHIAVPGPST
jgi:hypothetical protein